MVNQSLSELFWTWLLSPKEFIFGRLTPKLFLWTSQKISVTIASLQWLSSSGTCFFHRVMKITTILSIAKEHCFEMPEERPAFRAANFSFLISLQSGIQNIGHRKVFYYCNKWQICSKLCLTASVKAWKWIYLIQTKKTIELVTNNFDMQLFICVC